MSFTTHHVIQTDRLGGMICPQQWRTTFMSLGFGRLSDMCTHIHMCMHMCTHAGSRCLSPAAGLSTSRLLSMFWLLTGDSKGGPGFFLMLLTWAGVGFFLFVFFFTENGAISIDFTHTTWNLRIEFRPRQDLPGQPLSLQVRKLKPPKGLSSAGDHAGTELKLRPAFS